jgi:hypothetical protein
VTGAETRVISHARAISAMRLSSLSPLSPTCGPRSGNQSACLPVYLGPGDANSSSVIYLPTCKKSSSPPPSYKRTNRWRVPGIGVLSARIPELGWISTESSPVIGHLRGNQGIFLEFLVFFLSSPPLLPRRGDTGSRTANNMRASYYSQSPDIVSYPSIDNV